ncbi:MAG: hypothetical protein ABIS36_10740 [Chryseolinea sp.]
MKKKLQSIPHLRILSMKVLMLLPFIFLIGQCIDDYVKRPIYQSAHGHPVVICRSPLPFGMNALGSKGNAGKLNMTMLEIARSADRTKERIH